jgi:hypothetical protein
VKENAQAPGRGPELWNERKRVEQEEAQLKAGQKPEPARWDQEREREL